MTPAELIEVVINAQNRLDTAWALFLSVHAGLFGGIVYVDRPLRKAEKIVLIIAYGAVAAYNYYLVRNAQQLLKSLYQDVELFSQNATEFINTLQFLHSQAGSAWGWASEVSAWIVHGLAFIVVVVAIILDKPLKQLTRPSN